MIKIAIFNQKGGTAKTTTTFNIAGYLAKKYNQKVLIIDGDPQASISKTLLMGNENNSFAENKTIFSVLNKECNINDIIRPAMIKTRINSIPQDLGIDILPSSRGLSCVELESDYEIKNMIDKIEKKYDIILTDCSPYLSLLTINILKASDLVLVPATADKDSLDGYSQLIDTINMLRIKDIDCSTKILGIFITIMSFKESFDKYIFTKCKENFGEKFINLSIRRSTVAKQSSHFGIPLCWFKPSSKVAIDYERLTDIVIERIKRHVMCDRVKKDKNIKAIV